MLTSSEMGMRTGLVVHKTVFKRVSKLLKHVSSDECIIAAAPYTNYYKQEVAEKMSRSTCELTGVPK